MTNIVEKLENLISDFIERIDKEKKTIENLKVETDLLEKKIKDIESISKDLEKTFIFLNNVSLDEINKKINDILGFLEERNEEIINFVKDRIKGVYNDFRYELEKVKQDIEENIKLLNDRIFDVSKSLIVPVGSASYVNVYKDNNKVGTSDNLNFTGSGVQSVTYNSTTKRIDINIAGGGGEIGGTISSGQIAFGTGTNSIGGDNNLWWDNMNKRLGIYNPTPSYPVDIAENVRINGSPTKRLYMGNAAISFLASNCEITSSTSAINVELPSNKSFRVRPYGSSSITIDCKEDLSVVMNGGNNVFDSNGYGFVKVATFALALNSPATVGTNKTNELIIPRNGKIVKAFAYAKTAPQGSDLIFDINVNNTSIWNVNQNNRLKIVASQNSGTQTLFDITNITEGSRLTIDIDQVGSSVAGQDITIELLILVRNT